MNSDVITTLITVVIPSVVTLIGCMINNNVQRTKENAAIELKTGIEKIREQIQNLE